jgi:hypothetical protein
MDEPRHGEDAFMMGATHFVQGGWDAFTAEARGERAVAGAQKRYGTAAFGWGGLGGSAIWFQLARDVKVTLAPPCIFFFSRDSGWRQDAINVHASLGSTPSRSSGSATRSPARWKA